MTKFGKLLLALCGSAVLLTGCYRDEIAELHSQIDAIDIRGLEDQVKAMKNTVTDLETLKTQLAPVVEQLKQSQTTTEADVKLLKAAIENLDPEEVQKRIEELTTFINTFSSGMEQRVGALEVAQKAFATLDDLAKLQAAVDAVSKDLEKTVTEYVEKNVDKIVEKVVEWISESDAFKKLFNDYYTKSEIDGFLGIIAETDSLQNEDIAEIREMIAGLDTSIVNTVKELINGVTEKFDKKIGQIDSTLLALDAKSKKLEDLIGAGKLSTKDSTIIGAINELKAALDTVSSAGALTREVQKLSDAIAAVIGNPDQSVLRYSTVKALSDALVALEGVVGEAAVPDVSAATGLFKAIDDLDAKINALDIPEEYDDTDIRSAIAALATKIGTLKDLKTNDTTSIVAAINELKAAIDTASSAGALSRAVNTLNQAIADVIGNPGAVALDYGTIKDLSDALKALETAVGKASVPEGSDATGLYLAIETLGNRVSSLELNPYDDSVIKNSISAIKEEIGRLCDLNTNDTTSIVAAINELKEAIDSASSAGALSRAVNTLNQAIADVIGNPGAATLDYGTIKALNDALVSLKTAVGEAAVPSVSDATGLFLAIENLGNRVSALELNPYDDSEIKASIDVIKIKVGTLAELTTEDTSSIVAAINELVGLMDDKADAADIADLLDEDGVNSLINSALQSNIVGKYALLDTLDHYVTSKYFNEVIGTGVPTPGANTVLGRLIALESKTTWGAGSSFNGKNITDAIDTLANKIGDLNNYTQSQIEGFAEGVHNRFLDALLNGSGHSTLRHWLDSLGTDIDKIYANFDNLGISSISGLQAALDEIGTNIGSIDDIDGIGEDITDAIVNLKDSIEVWNDFIGSQDLIESIGRGNTIMAVLSDLSGAVNTLSQQMGNTTMDEVISRLEDLESDVADLKSRIQSVVFVPEYKGGDAVATYSKDKGTTTFSPLALEYRVSPAEAAKSIKTTDVKVYYKSVKTKASALDTLKVSSVVTSSEEDGTIIVTVSDDAEKGLNKESVKAILEASDKALALQIAINLGNGTSVLSGFTDVTTINGTPTNVTGITITPDEEKTKFYVGETWSFTAVVTPNNADYDRVSWKIDPETRATMTKISGDKDTKCTIKATAPGKVYLTATAGGKSDTYEINVLDPDTGGSGLPEYGGTTEGIEF